MLGLPIYEVYRLGTGSFTAGCVVRIKSDVPEGRSLENV